MKIDLSIVWNLHNEMGYLPRTLKSIEEAAAFAQWRGITIELVIVLDNAPQQLLEWIHAYDYRVFNAYKIVAVENGSLGLSRNDGIQNASGEYIATADGDDLMSFNMFWESFELAAQNEQHIVCPEYLYSFGDKTYMQQYLDSDSVPNVLFAGSNPYTSRILCRKSIFDRLTYIDARGGLKAFEDWHFNCEALAAGYKFKTAKKTILFYRQRPNSIMATAKNKIIPPTKYFSPDVFTSLCSTDYDEHHNKSWLEIEPLSIRRNKVVNSVLMEMLFLAANKIDPMVDVNPLKYSDYGLNIGGPLAFGLSYYEACQSIGDGNFTDVLLLPFLSKGGGEKYITQILSAIKEIKEGARFLVLCGEGIGTHEGVSLLPSDSTLLDLHKICSTREVSHINLLALRLIQAVAPNATIHVKSCPFAFGFFKEYGTEIERNKTVFYYFSEYEYCSERRTRFQHGVNFNFISDNIDRLDCIVSDHSRILRFARKQLPLDHLNVLYRAIFSLCPVRDNYSKRYTQNNLSKKILWASRLDNEKRPDLVKLIARHLHSRCSDITIDMYGTSVFGGYSTNEFECEPNISYCGGFTKFSDLDSARYDAFIYTSHFDGLPNIILEAVSEYLLVIAPDVGGISEIINEETGVLLSSLPDDEAMAAQYADAILDIYSGALDCNLLAENAASLLRARHSSETFVSEVRAVYAAV